MSRKAVSRVAKGKRPVYFADPATDKLMAIVLTLVEELSVTRERLDALERVLEEHGQLDRCDVEQFEPSHAARADRDTDRVAYIERVMRVVTMELQRPDETGATESFKSTLKQMMEADD